MTLAAAGFSWTSEATSRSAPGRSHCAVVLAARPRAGASSVADALVALAHARGFAAHSTAQPHLSVTDAEAPYARPKVDLLEVLDVSAWAHDEQTKAVIRADTTLLVSTPSAGSQVATYALVKRHAAVLARKSLWLIVNQAISTPKAHEAAERFAHTCEAFLQLRLEGWAVLPFCDAWARRGVRAHKAGLEDAATCVLGEALHAWKGLAGSAQDAWNRTFPSTGAAARAA